MTVNVKRLETRGSINTLVIQAFHAGTSVLGNLSALLCSPSYDERTGWRGFDALSNATPTAAAPLNAGDQLIRRHRPGSSLFADQPPRAQVTDGRLVGGCMMGCVTTMLFAGHWWNVGWSSERPGAELARAAGACIRYVVFNREFEKRLIVAEAGRTSRRVTFKKRSVGLGRCRRCLHY